MPVCLMANKSLEDLRISIALGRELASRYPEIADYYREGKTREEIVEMIQRNGGFGGEYSNRVLRNSIRWALVGNDREEIGPDYFGLMTPREYKEITRFGKGGAMPWELSEIAAALRLEKQKYKPESIAKILNIAYHFGREVRSEPEVEKKLKMS